MTVSDNFIIHNSKKFFFELIYQNNRTQSISIKVNHDGKIVIRAPKTVAKYKIINIINSNVDWIYKKIKELKTKQSLIPKFQYIAGEEHYYLGNKYKINIIKNSKLDTSLYDNQINIWLNNQNDVKIMLFKWYTNEAMDIFNARFENALKNTYWVKSRPNLVLKFMKSQWGSCSSNNKISLNIHLIKTPIECIDYVIYHELCHVLVKDHSKNFYKLLEEVSPNYKVWRRYLRENGRIFITH